MFLSLREGVGRGLGAFVGALSGLGTRGAAALGQGFGLLLRGIGTGATFLATRGTALIGTGIRALISSIAKAAQSFYDAGRGLTSSVMGGIGSLVGRFVGLFSTAFNTLKVTWATAGLAIIGTAATVARALGMEGLANKLDKAAGHLRRFRDEGNAALGGLKDQEVNITARTFTVEAGGRRLQVGARSLGRLASGGPVRGPGTGTSDTAGLFALSNGEHVLTAREVQAAGGHRAIEHWRSSLVTGRRMADGGGIGVNVRVPSPRGIADATERAVDRVAGVFARAVQRRATEIGGDAGGGGMGWQRQIALLRSAFPGLPLFSGFRPGARTTSGNLSYHARGRAVDVPPRMDVFNWIRSNYGRSSAELIFSPAGGRQLYRGRPHTYTGAVRRMHFNHVHWAMANGGVIGEPVVGTGLRSGNSYSFAERGPEAVLPLAGRGVRATQVVVNVTFTGPVNGTDGRQLAQSLAPALRDEFVKMKNRGVALGFTP